eukprot:9097614-Pyramimonas_sp.AAC.1
MMDPSAWKDGALSIIAMVNGQMQSIASEFGYMLSPESLEGAWSPVVEFCLRDDALLSEWMGRL